MTQLSPTPDPRPRPVPSAARRARRAPGIVERLDLQHAQESSEALPRNLRAGAARQAMSGQSFNAMSIDVEDYFQVAAFAPYIERANWDSLECRVERSLPAQVALAGGELAQRVGEVVRQRPPQPCELLSLGTPLPALAPLECFQQRLLHDTRQVEPGVQRRIDLQTGDDLQGIAQPVLWFLWKALPRSTGYDILKLVVFLGILAFVGNLARLGLLPRTRPIVPGELAVSD